MTKMNKLLNKLNMLKMAFYCNWTLFYSTLYRDYNVQFGQHNLAWAKHRQQWEAMRGNWPKWMIFKKIKFILLEKLQKFQNANSSEGDTLVDDSMHTRYVHLLRMNVFVKFWLTKSLSLNSQWLFYQNDDFLGQIFDDIQLDLLWLFLNTYTFFLKKSFLFLHLWNMLCT